jgi:hypothetical protein
VADTDDRTLSDPDEGTATEPAVDDEPDPHADLAAGETEAGDEPETDEDTAFGVLAAEAFRGGS